MKYFPILSLSLYSSLFPLDASACTPIISENYYDREQFEVGSGSEFIGDLLTSYLFSSIIEIVIIITTIIYGFRYLKLLKKASGRIPGFYSEFLLLNVTMFFLSIFWVLFGKAILTYFTTTTVGDCLDSKLISPYLEINMVAIVLSIISLLISIASAIWLKKVLSK